MPSLPGDWGQRSVGVYGMGLSGSAAARFLRARGARVRLFDDREVSPERLAELGLGELAAPIRATTPEDFHGLEALVLSPGLPLTAPARMLAEQAGVPVLGELELAGRGFEERITIVTGSHGKSTVTSWSAVLQRAAGHTATACGNIGLPLAEVLLEASQAPERLQVEASSFQLHDATRLRVARAVFTAYAPNHLDWHPDEDHYRETKLALLDRLLPGAEVVYLPGFPGLEERLVERGLPAVPVGPGGAYGYDEDFPGQVRCPDGALDLGSLEGGAALVPLAPAIALAAAAAGVGQEVVVRAVPDLRALPHRLENLGVKRGRRFFNDSKATTPAASAYSLARVPGATVLILGGKDKGLAFAPFAEVFAKARALVFTGAARERLERELGHLPHEVVADFDGALAKAVELCPEGGSILLAPGCSSYDCFPNFEVRGDHFRGFVDALEEAP